MNEISFMGTCWEDMLPRPEPSDFNHPVFGPSLPSTDSVVLISARMCGSVSVGHVLIIIKP